MPNDDLGLGIEQLTQLVIDQDKQLDKQQKATAYLAEMLAIMLRRNNHVSPETQAIMTSDDTLVMEGWELAFGTNHTGGESYLFVKPPNATQATEQEMIDASRKNQREQREQYIGLYGVDGQPITRKPS